jgi:hypothetical protein
MRLKQNVETRRRGAMEKEVSFSGAGGLSITNPINKTEFPALPLPTLSRVGRVLNFSP